MASISRRIIAFAQRLRFEDLPAEVVSCAKARILDTLGVGLAAASLPEGRGVFAAARRLGTGDEASAWGFGARLPAPSAALVNGTLVHSLEFDDTHRASIVHGSSVVVTSAFAAAEREQASGAELIRAIVAAWEVFARMGLAAPGALQRRGFQITAVGGPYVAALTASMLARADPDRTAAAMGIAGSQGGGIFEYLSNGATVKSLHPGWAAHAGLCAQLLAAQGMTGPETVFEGRFGFYAAYAADGSLADAFAREIDSLGERWLLPQASLKLYACCHYNHPFLECLERLIGQGLGAHNLRALECRGPQEEAMLIAEPWSQKVAPRSGYDAKFSLPYCLAWRLLRGPLDVETFACAPDPAVIALAGRMSWVGERDSGFPARFPATLIATLDDGRTLHAAVPDVLGSPERPAPVGALQDKFTANATRLLDPSACHALRAWVDRLEHASDCSAIPLGRSPHGPGGH